MMQNNLVRNARSRLSRCTLRTKLIGSFLVVITLTMGVGAVGYRGMQSENRASNALYSTGAKPIVALYALNGDVDGERIRAYRHGMAFDAKAMAEYESQIHAKEQAVNADVAAYVKLFPHIDAKRAALVAKFEKRIATYRKVVHQTFLPASRAKSPALNSITENQLSPLGLAAGDVLDELSQLEIAQAATLQVHANATYHSETRLLLGLLGLGIVAAIALALLISTQTSRSVRKLESVVDGLAEGDLTRHAELSTQDELGRMAASLDRALERTRSVVVEIGRSSQALAASSEALDSVSSQLASTASVTASEAQNASDAAGQISAHVSSVAAGTEEMAASIQEIASHAGEASTIASNAVAQAAATNDTITELGDASSQIGDVVQAITAIAEQTNLLALNATIEAARAGEMGKGFAVVATEVKELAQQTANATADVATRISAIQTNTTASVEAIGRIGDTIGRINDATATIAAAVEEQTVTTNAIGRSVSEAAEGSGEIARHVSGVAQGATQTTEAVQHTRQAAIDVARMAGELEQLIGQFRY
jgi:methyl-accepting chemotaxis protein